MKKHIIFFVSVSPFILIGSLLATFFRGQQFTAGDMLGQFITGLVIAGLGYFVVNKFILKNEVNTNTNRN